MYTKSGRDVREGGGVEGKGGGAVFVSREVREGGKEGEGKEGGTCFYINRYGTHARGSQRHMWGPASIETEGRQAATSRQY